MPITRFNHTPFTLRRRESISDTFPSSLEQLVDGKLFTGSHDARLIVWDAKGINRDTGFGGTPANDTANNSTARSVEPSDEKVCSR